MLQVHDEQCAAGLCLLVLYAFDVDLGQTKTVWASCMVAQSSHEATIHMATIVRGVSRPVDL